MPRLPHFGSMALLLTLGAALLLAACDDGGDGGDPDAVSDTVAPDTITLDTGEPTDTSEPSDTVQPDVEACPGGCDDPARPVCNVATMQCQECVTDPDCEGSPNGNACAGGICVVRECQADADCADGERCQAGRCRAQVVTCTTSLDCPVSRPACVVPQGEQSGECAAFSQCTGDDASEDGDDGPAGAVDITVDAGASHTVTGLAVCSAPLSERDWFAFTVADGDSVTLTVTPDDAASDLDVDVLGPQLEAIGLSWWRSPEVLELTYLPAGTYYLVVSLYTGQTGQAAAVGYSVDIERTAGACQSAADCAAAYDTQYLRGECGSSGACVEIPGGGGREFGAACDTRDDCASELCTYNAGYELSLANAFFYFFADADTRAFCSAQCASDTDCGAGTICSPTFGLCVAPCTANAQCPIFLGLEPEPGDTWRHMTCDVASGECLELDPSITASAQVVQLGEVVIDEVGSHGPGWVAVHADEGGAPGAILGSTQVDSGLTSGVTVALSRDIVDGETLHAMLHVDAGTPGTFEPEGADASALDLSGAVVSASFVVSEPMVMLEPLVATASPQTLDQLTSHVVIDQVISESDGWIVVHADDGAGAPGTLLGQSAVGMGESLAVLVELDRPAVDGETLHAMLHEDLGTPGTFEPGTDALVLNSLGIEVVQAFDVIVPATTPDVRLSAASSGSTGYTFSLVAPAWATGIIGAAAEDPTLTLTRGWRYAIDNTVVAGHPLEYGVIDPALASSTDVISLSQQVGDDPTLETDTTIDWSESGSTLAFTVSATFETAVTGYRCAFHTAMMRGDVAYID